MENEKTIEVLNSLVTINNDRVEGYETAIGETQEQDLKDLFAQLARTSQKCKQELVNEVTRLGGKPTEGTKASGKIYRIWMEFKSAVTGKDRKAILASCEFGEDAAVDTYFKVLENQKEDITAEQQAMIRNQYNLIKADHDKIKRLRDELIELN